MSDVFDEFLKKYGNLGFDNIKFRPGAPFTCEFGFDDVFGSFRFHNAVDRGNSGPDPAKNPIYAPFEGYLTWISDIADFGSLLLLKTDYDFEVRIAHMESISPEAQMYTISKSKIPAGTYLGAAGNKGKSTGIHTHTEIVSISKTSCNLLDEILEAKYKARFRNYYELGNVESYFKDRKLPTGNKTIDQIWKEYRVAKGIINCNQYVCIRRDYLTKEVKTFYNSRALFGM